jgi:di/tricarboxylate transporter
MFQILNGFVTDAEGLMKTVIVVLGIAFVAATWWRTKAAAPTLGAVMLAVVVVFAVNNFRGLSEDIERDVDDRRGGTTATGGRDARRAGD